MAVVTLTTDWGLNDFYSGCLKGRLLSISKDIYTVDISHTIRPFDVLNAAYVVGCCYSSFPDGTIHIIGVNSEPKREVGWILVKSQGHYFVTPDLGVCSLFLEGKPDFIIKIVIEKASSYASIDVFGKVVDSIFNKKDVTELGTEIDNYRSLMNLNPIIESNVVLCSVIFVDAFANIVVNIKEDAFKRIQANRNFTIFVASNSNRIQKLSDNYSDVADGELVAFFNMGGFLEIALNRGTLAELFSISKRDSIRIEFE